MALKMPINEKVDVALIYDQPFGANIAYPFLVPPYFAATASAELHANALTGVVRYRFSDRISVFGGIRAQTLEGSAAIPFIGGPGGYTVSAGRDLSFGYVVGAAYEIPEYALRVALTYNSKISHESSTTETSGILGTNTSITSLDMPQSVNLEFQTGIAEGTLVFGSVRWVEWSEFDFSLADYSTLTGGGTLVEFDNDVFTYNLGVARQLNENWAVSGRVTYEKSNGGFASNLGPTDGMTSVALAVTYMQDDMKITAGVSHTWIGDAETELGGSGLPAGVFTDNHATAFGMKIGFNF